MTKIQTTGSVLAALAVGYVLGTSQGTVVAQAPTVTAPTPRYQISAWAYAGNPSNPSPKHGYYIVDTVTGGVWLSDTNDKPVAVSTKLP
jgi:hypothetical protein